MLKSLRKLLKRENSFFWRFPEIFISQVILMMQLDTPANILKRNYDIGVFL